MADISEFPVYPDTEVNALDPQDVLEQEGRERTDVDHEPAPDADVLDDPDAVDMSAEAPDMEVAK